MHNWVVEHNVATFSEPYRDTLAGKAKQRLVYTTNNSANLMSSC